MNIPRLLWEIIGLGIAIGFLSASAVLLLSRPAEAQVPACIVEGTPVPCPTATPVPPTPVPTATAVPPTPTPFPIYPPRVTLYQDFSACGVLQVRASYEATIIPYRVILTRNGVVLPLTQVDFFNSASGILLAVPTSAGDVFKAFAFPQNTAPQALPGTFFEAPANQVGVLPGVIAVPPCPVISTPAATATPTVSEQIIAALKASQPTPQPAPQLPVVGASIRPPSTGDAGLVR